MLNLKYPWRLKVTNLGYCVEIWVNVSGKVLLLETKKVNTISKEANMHNNKQKKNLGCWMLLPGWPCKWKQLVSKQTCITAKKNKPWLLNASSWMTLQMETISNEANMHNSKKKNRCMLDTSSRVTLQNHGATKTVLTWNNKTNKITKKRTFNRQRIPY